MALTVGSRLGHYDVTSLLGEGGMGQVWQATDTQLNRQVALKVLPDAFTDDPDRLARFRREAQVLASLNHPNIAQIHGGADTQRSWWRARLARSLTKPSASFGGNGVAGTRPVFRGDPWLGEGPPQETCLWRTVDGRSLTAAGLIGALPGQP